MRDQAAQGTPLNTDVPRSSSMHDLARTRLEPAPGLVADSAEGVRWQDDQARLIMQQVDRKSKLYWWETWHWLIACDAGWSAGQDHQHQEPPHAEPRYARPPGHHVAGGRRSPRLHAHVGRTWHGRHAGTTHAAFPPHDGGLAGTRHDARRTGATRHDAGGTGGTRHDAGWTRSAKYAAGRTRITRHDAGGTGQNFGYTITECRAQDGIMQVPVAGQALRGSMHELNKNFLR